ncbi:hypothetical protein A9Q84_00420 [Halobacteriovorax marinus]|uniref:SRPBCC family protein n=1 Tax=Halobacteriovorax marinus TaxID=97084 RepID=A0A1Y5FI41_9BACT|nr:hypothetical protein A9Q84_00420 [Halobacteriovorax marinus]
MTKLETINLDQQYAGDVELIWSYWSDLENLCIFSSEVLESRVVTSIKKGIGAQRICVMKNGGEIRETVKSYSEEDHFFELSVETDFLPYKEALVSFSISEVSRGISKVNVQMRFVPRFSFLGVMLSKIIIKPNIKRMFNKLLEDFEIYFARIERKDFLINSQLEIVGD